MPSATTAPELIAIDKRRRAGVRLRSVLRPVLMLGAIVAVAVGAGWWWLQGGRFVSIDNSYVRASKLAISNDISGIVGEVDVHEGQHVKKGDVLLRLQDRQVRIALAGAKANLDQVAETMAAMKRDYQRMLRDIDVKQAQVEADQASFDRYAGLVKGGGVTRAEYDDARFKLAADKAALESLREQAAVQLARLGGDPNVDVTTHAAVPGGEGAGGRGAAPARSHRGARAVRRHRHQCRGDAARHVSRRRLRRVRRSSPTEHVWVEANPKETDLT